MSQLASRILLLHQNVAEFLADPWFSSLWTLQEATLCPEAHLLSREADRVMDDTLHNTFGTFLSMMNVLIFICNSVLGHNAALPENDEEVRDACRSIIELVQHRGLPALISGNHLNLYSAAGNRTASDPRDYVYGIQQIFGYRLGRTAEGAPTVDADGEHWTPSRLEVELGRRLLADFPVVSQMHIFTRPRESRQQGWHIGLSSRIPEPLPASGHVWTGIWEEPLHPACSLKAEKVQGMWLGRFKGMMCTFSALDAAWRRANEARGKEFSYQRVLLDIVSPRETQGLDEPPEYRTEGYAREARPGSQQNQLSSWLASSFAAPVHRLHVLKLGTREDEDSREICGLILLEADTLGDLTYWQRLGICHWSVPAPGGVDQSLQSVLYANDHTDWFEGEGYFS